MAQEQEPEKIISLMPGTIGLVVLTNRGNIFFQSGPMKPWQKLNLPNFGPLDKIPDVKIPENS